MVNLLVDNRSNCITNYDIVKLLIDEYHSADLNVHQGDDWRQGEALNYAPLGIITILLN